MNKRISCKHTQNIQKGGIMTQNQLQYWANKETERANRARERENERSNKENEQIRADANAVNREKTQSEYSIAQNKLSEDTRAHKAGEQEAIRNDKANNALTYMQRLTESRNADTKEYEAGSGRIQAQAAASQANTAALQQQENRRSNLVNEAIKAIAQQEVERHDKAAEGNDRFKNVTGYSTNATNASTNYGNLLEQQQHNRNTEIETKRKNLTDQYINSLQLQDQINYHNWTVMSDLLSNIKPNIRYNIGGIK